jgi:hypothetical protein
MGVDEIYKGKKDKFLTVVCILETDDRFGSARSTDRRGWTRSKPPAGKTTVVARFIGLRWARQTATRLSLWKFNSQILSNLWGPPQ